MSWSPPTEVVTGQVVTAELWNTQVVGNLRYLKQKPYTIIQQTSEPDIPINWIAFQQLSPSITASVYSSGIDALTHIYMQFGGYFASAYWGTLFYIDFLVNGTFYLSSRTATPKPNGCWMLRGTAAEGAAYTRQHFVNLYVKGLDTGTHVLTPYVRGNYSSSYHFIVDRTNFDFVYMLREV